MEEEEVDLLANTDRKDPMMSEWQNMLWFPKLLW
jgi:hypothetical protein